MKDLVDEHEAGELTVRKRIERLFDSDSFDEIGLLATHARKKHGVMPV
jgi:acetyl-CoA carboxylase carboxyltransferase component